MFRISAILALAFVSIANTTCSAQVVLREYVRDQFLSYHNKHRTDHSAPLLSWSEELAAKANTDALKLSAICWANTLGNGKDANILQVWGSRAYKPVQVLEEWMREKKSRKVILDGALRLVGCGYVPCKDPGSYATAIIYICRYEGDPNVKDCAGNAAVSGSAE